MCQSGEKQNKTPKPKNQKTGSTWKLQESTLIANYKQILVDNLNKKRGKKQKDLGCRQADERVLVDYSDAFLYSITWEDVIFP